MFDSLSFAYGSPDASGEIKVLPEDFCVDEHLGFELSGEGEHLFLRIEKKGLNTEEMMKILSKEFNISMKLISYAGLKDKYAQTTQWFSLHLPGIADPEFDGLNTESYRLLEATRHHKKLKIGGLKENHFKIKVKHFQYNEVDLLSRIETIKTQGVPNYFGPQRFGHNGSNLERAKQVLLENKKIKNRHLRGIYYSAARSFLFNQIVSLRAKEGCWNLPLSGDLMMLAGTNSVFYLDEVDDKAIERVRERDIFPAAILWGKGQERLTQNALSVQTMALEPWKEWCIALEKQGLQQAYRSMVLVPEDLEFTHDTFSFTLPKGTFATTVLRELFNVKS